MTCTQYDDTTYYAISYVGEGRTLNAVPKRLEFTDIREPSKKAGVCLFGGSEELQDRLQEKYFKIPSIMN